uniref:RING-type E3 ubiquitin transferase n=1 Tax=Anthurium amnicola TaxID=1678845 RepID=A0A1D1XS92_9ARAE
MSSGATSDGADGGTGQDSATYWCHECDMGVALRLSPPPLVCPHCGGCFLEEMEELRPRRRPAPSRSRTLSPPRLRHSGADAGGEGVNALPRFDQAGDGGDLDDPVGFSLRNGPHGGGSGSSSNAEDYYEAFDRLMSHIVSSAHNTVGEDDPSFGGDGGGGVSRPASKSSVEAIPTVQITEAFLAADPSLLCAVCKDEFVLLTEARQLPCSHIYHPDCILPWLSHHNSCPVCRFQLPTDDPACRRRPRARVDEPRVVFGNLLDEDGDEEVDRDVREIHSMLRSVFPGRTPAGDTDDVAEVDGDFLSIGGILSRIARRRRLSSSRRSSRLSVQDAAATSTTTQLARAEMGSQGPANSAEMVSSLWPLDEGTSVGGTGGRVDEEGGMIISEVRRLYN